jgi:cytoskeletal protein CcmA (bactofilin family)
MFKKIKIDPPDTPVPASTPVPENAKPMINSTEEPTQPVKRSGGPIGVAVLDTHKPTVISEGFSLTGDIVSDGILHIEGRTSGTIKASSINIGPRGHVEGNVACASLHVKGTFSGTAVCAELVVAASAIVRGHITYQLLTIGRGASIEGDLVVRN